MMISKGVIGRVQSGTHCQSGTQGNDNIWKQKLFNFINLQRCPHEPELQYLLEYHTFLLVELTQSYNQLTKPWLHHRANLPLTIYVYVVFIVSVWTWPCTMIKPLKPNMSQLLSVSMQWEELQLKPKIFSTGHLWQLQFVLMWSRSKKLQKAFRLMEQICKLNCKM